MPSFCAPSNVTLLVLQAHEPMHGICEFWPSVLRSQQWRGALGQLCQMFVLFDLPNYVFLQGIQLIQSKQMSKSLESFVRLNKEEVLESVLG